MVMVKWVKQLLCLGATWRQYIVLKFYVSERIERRISRADWRYLSISERILTSDFLVVLFC